LLEEGMILF